MLKLLVIIGICCVSTAFGQTFENIRTQKDEDKIIIVYDLVSIDQGSKVIVSIFSSLDNYILPLTNVTGDVGTVFPGPNKRIIWKAGEVIANDFEGISFKFKGENFIGWKIISPTNNVFIRGKKNTIQWQGGAASDDVIIQLIKPGLEEQDLLQTKNSGSFTWNIPKDFKPGNGYAMRITSGENSIEHRFSVKRKVPLGYYAIPVGVGILLVVLVGGDSGSNDLPDAPLPN